MTQRALVRLGVLWLGLPGDERERLLHELMDLPVAKDSDPRLRCAMLYATRSMDPEDPAEDRLEEAAEVAEAAVWEVDRARQRGPIWGHAERTEFDLLLDRAAAVAADLDDVERARELWERICDGEDADPVLAARCELQLCQLARAQDDAITAVRHFRRAADGAQELDLPGEWASAVLSLPYLVGATDGPDAAFAVLDDAGAVLDHISARVLSGEWADAMHPEAPEHMRAEHEECRVRLLAGVGRFDEVEGRPDDYGSA